MTIRFLKHELMEESKIRSMSEEIAEELQKQVEKEELARHISTARAEIEHNMEQPAAQAANGVGEMSFFAAVKKAAEPHIKKITKFGMKDIKAQGATLIGLLPLIGGGSAAMSAGKATYEAARLEGASKFRAGLIGFRTGSSELRAAQAAKFGHVLKGEKELYDAARLEGAGKIRASVMSRQGEALQFGKHLTMEKIMEAVDLTPDVPPLVSLTSGVAGLVLPGVGAIPGAWQMVANRLELIKESAGAGIDVGKVVLGKIDEKINGLKRPEVAQSAKAFV